MPAPLRIDLLDVGHAKVEELASTRWVAGWLERNVGLVVGRSSPDVEDQPAVVNLQHHRVALVDDLGAKDAAVPLARAILVLNDEEVGDDHTLAGSGKVFTVHSSVLLSGECWFHLESRCTRGTEKDP